MSDTSTVIPDTLLSVSNLALERAERPLISGFNLTVSPGQAWIITGANGIGKTTLLRALAGLVRAKSGDVQWPDGASPPALLDHALALKPSETVRQALTFFAALHDHDHTGVQTITDRMQLAYLLDRPCGRLSAGQRQRVSLARVWLSGRRVWLLDEPAGPLDDKGRRVLADLVQDHRDQGGAVIAVTHRSLDWPNAKTRELEA